MTQKMLERAEELKAEYNTIIMNGNPDETEFEFAQWQRLNGIICYLEERLAR